MGWTLNLDVGEKSAEMICSQLWDSGTSGIVEIDGQLVAGFDSYEQAKLAGSQIGLPHNVKLNEDEWRQPSLDKLVVKTAAGQIDLDLESSQVFGHGNHPTTQLALGQMIGQLEKLDSDEDTSSPRVLDVGTGSGVLAIVAAKLGAKVLALDIDTQAVATAKENAAKNGVEVQVSDQALDAVDASFDLVVCNVLLPVHQQLAHLVQSKLAPQSFLVVSGFLKSQEKALLRFYSDLKVAEVGQIGIWSGIALTPSYDRTNRMP